MARGRRAQPDEVKALKGNPGKRRLALEGAGRPDRQTKVGPIPIPEFLTNDREREIFKRIIDDYLQRRIARPTDLTAYARWASYVHRWVSCKEQLDGKATWFKSESKWGALLRRHPLFKDMLDLERVLQSLEDRLGLNPIARQNIIRGLAAVPPALGGLFGEEDPPKEDRPQPEMETPAADVGPLGYLQAAAGKLN
jgi:phage terminase small subunit